MARISRMLLCSVASLASVLTPQSEAAAPTIADFKAASEQAGCKSIPYPDERDECEDLQDEINNYCKTDVIDCDGLLKKKEDLKISIVNHKRRIEELENKKAPLVRERDAMPSDQEGQIRSFNEKIKDVDEDIAEVKEDLEELTDDFEDFDRDNRADVAVERAQKCFDFRTQSNKVFAYLVEQLYKEPTKTLGSTPSEGVDFDAAKRELEAYAVKIIDGMKRATPGHEDQAEDAEGRIKNCKKVLDLDLDL